MALPQSKRYLELFTGLGGGQGFTAAVSPNILGKREYNREVRGTVLTLDGDDTRLTLPAQCATSLNLQHKFIGLHLFATSGVASLEVNVIEEKGRQAVKRKICLSSRRQHPSVAGDTAQVPLKVPTQTWMFLCINLPQLVSHCFGGVYSYLESISIGSWCSVRRILSLREPVSTSYYPGNGCIPKQFDLPASARCPLISVPYVASVGGADLLSMLSVTNARADGGIPDLPVSPIQGIVVNGVGAVGRRGGQPTPNPLALKPAGALADQSPTREATGDFLGMLKSGTDAAPSSEKPKGKVQKGAAIVSKQTQPQSPSLDALDDFMLDCCMSSSKRKVDPEVASPSSDSAPDAPARAAALNGRMKPSSAPPANPPRDASFQYPHHPDDPDLRRPMSAFGCGPSHHHNQRAPHYHVHGRRERDRDRADTDRHKPHADPARPPDYFEACPFGSWDANADAAAVDPRPRKVKLGKSIEEWVHAKADFCPEVTPAWGEPRMVGYMCGGDEREEGWDPEPGTEPPTSSLSGRYSEHTIAE